MTNVNFICSKGCGDLSMEFLNNDDTVLVTNVNVDYSRFLFSTVTPVTYIEKMLSYKNWQQPWNVKTCFAWSWIFSDDNEHTKKKIMFSKQRERESVTQRKLERHFYSFTAL